MTEVPSSRADYITVQVTMNPLELNTYSDAYVDHFDELGFRTSANLLCGHWVTDDSGGTVQSVNETVHDSHWTHDFIVNVPAGSPEPLVLDLNGDGVRTTDLDHLVWFDLDGNGSKDHITWTNSATMEGFLWVNVDGKRNCVDDGSELFGIGTVLPDGTKATDGFQALSMYDLPSQDGNDDGVIDTSDVVWNKLRVWIDENHDGVCQPTEVNPLHKFGAESIPLNAVRTTFVDENGNGHSLRGHYTRRVDGRIQFFEIDALTFQGAHR